MKKLLYSQAQWIGKVLNVDWDKVLHFQVGFIFNTIVFLLSYMALDKFGLIPALFGSFIIALVLTGYLGLSNELYDQEQPNNYFSEADIRATTYGGLLSSLILILILIF